MLISLFYIFLAIAGLGFLVFIHELGHYFVARREGMRVEAFSIGFGKALFSWKRDGVHWQIGWLPLGGYVRIAGMQKEGNREPHEISDGFYAKRPMQRIRVALAGPIVNIVFALAAFSLLWTMGGLKKPFGEFTHYIGWVDPASDLYRSGVRPGDTVESYGGHAFHGRKDLDVASIMDHNAIRIQGQSIDYETGYSHRFDYTFPTYHYPSTQDKISTIGFLAPAQYLIVTGAVAPDSPAYGVGIQPSDRVLWADGEQIFSAPQLSSLVNESTAFLTVQRGDQLIHSRIPRVHVDELKISAFERDELDDWQYAAHLKGRLDELYFMPYFISYSGVVEGPIPFIDQKDQERAFSKCERCAYFDPLMPGDRILAIDGERVTTSYDLLRKLQDRRVLLIVQRDPVLLSQPILWTQGDEEFRRSADLSDVKAIVDSIGATAPISHSGSLYLVTPVSPKPMGELTEYQQRIAERKKEIATSVRNPQQAEDALRRLEEGEKKLILGLSFAQDREVVYNPDPWNQFIDVVDETQRTLTGLVSGSVSPKLMAGPVGIVQVVHHSWMMGGGEALFWMAVISLNLAILNLLPIPVLDGGHVLIAFVEMVTRRRLSAKAMERIVFPFIVLVVCFFLYVTFHDILRLFT
jgi:regulator of sigma E protease